MNYQCRMMNYRFAILLLCFFQVFSVTTTSFDEYELEEDIINVTSTSTEEPAPHIDPTGDAFYGCGFIKRCYSRYSKPEVNSDCIAHRSCDMMVSFGKGLGETPEHDEAVIEIFSVSKGWAAMGISMDEKMGDDYVMECAREGAEMKMYNSWNFPGRMNVRLRNTESFKHNIRVIAALYYENRLYCKFYIKKKFTKMIQYPSGNKSYEFDLNEYYYYIMSFSNEIAEPIGEEEGNLKSHVLHGGFSDQNRDKVSASEMLSPLPYQAQFFRVHAIFMIIGWMFFMTVAVFTARYLKETMVNLKIRRFEFWSFCHILAAILGAICITLSFIFVTLGKAGWVNMFRAYFHTYSGIIAFCLFVFNFLLGFCLKPTAAKKHILNRIHSFTGHISYNLAILNMLFSARVAYGFLPCNFGAYIYAWFFVYYLMHAILSYHYCWVDFSLGRTRDRKYATVAQLRHEEKLKALILSYTGTSRLSARQSKRVAELAAAELDDDDSQSPQDAPVSRNPSQNYHGR